MVMARNDTGWGGVFTLYPVRKFFKGCILPIVMLSFSILFYLLSTSSNPISILNAIIGYVVSGYPSIIGFVLTGYALIIGFSSSELISKMVNVKVEGDYSYFQVINSIFATVLLIVVCTYIVACVCSYVIMLEIEWPFEIVSSCRFNEICLFSFLFLFYYSIVSLIDVVVNIFNIGQFANAVARNKSEIINDVEKDGDVNSIDRIKCRLMECLENKIDEFLEMRKNKKQEN